MESCHPGGKHCLLVRGRKHFGTHVFVCGIGVVVLGTVFLLCKISGLLAKLLVPGTKWIELLLPINHRMNLGTHILVENKCFELLYVPRGHWVLRSLCRHFGAW